MSSTDRNTRGIYYYTTNDGRRLSLYFPDSAGKTRLKEAIAGWFPSHSPLSHDSQQAFLPLNGCEQQGCRLLRAIPCMSTAYSGEWARTAVIICSEPSLSPEASGSGDAVVQGEHPHQFLYLTVSKLEDDPTTGGAQVQPRTPVVVTRPRGWRDISSLTATVGSGHFHAEQHTGPSRSGIHSLALCDHELVAFEPYNDGGEDGDYSRCLAKLKSSLSRLLDDGTPSLRADERLAPLQSQISFANGIFRDRSLPPGDFSAAPMDAIVSLLATVYTATLLDLAFATFEATEGSP